MTPEERVADVCRHTRLNIPLYVRDIMASAIRDAVREEREACADVCDAISEDKHAQYKGHPPHAPNNEHRADTHTEGESDGADLCAVAIRARGETP